MDLQATTTATAAGLVATRYLPVDPASGPHSASVHAFMAPVVAEEVVAPVKCPLEAAADCEFACRFVEHLMAEHARRNGRPDGHRPSNTIDWEAILTSTRGARSIEHAIGRMIVTADQLARSGDAQVGSETAATRPSRMTEEPFFSFTLSDVEPDFGDDRYRSKVADKVGDAVGLRRVGRTIVAALTPRDATLRGH